MTFMKACLRKVVAVFAAAAVVVAAAIGIGLSSFMKAPIQPDASPAEPAVEAPSETSAPETSVDANDINSLENIPGYFGLVNLGYSDEMARYLSSIKLEMISSDNTYYHYVQTTPEGTRSESILSFTPNEEFDTAGAEKITVSPGFEIFVKHRQVDKLENGYHISLAYFIPEESTPADLKDYLSSIQPVYHQWPYGVQHASATGTQIYGAGVAISQDVTVVSPPRITAAPLEPVSTLTSPGFRELTAERIREVQQMIIDRDRLAEDFRRASEAGEVYTDPIRVEGADTWAEQRIAAEREALEQVRDRAIREEAAQALSRTAGAVATGFSTGWTLSNILDDFMRGYDGLNAGRDCWRNPTNRLAQDAQRNDPNYERLGEQLDSAQEGHYVNTGARGMVVAFDVAASAAPGVGFAGGLALGSASQGFDAVLADGQFDEINDALSGITPCDPCPEDQQFPESEPSSEPQESGLDYTPGPGDPNYTGLNYTPGPPGPRPPHEPPEDLVCRPPEPNTLRVVIHNSVQAGVEQTRQITFQASANLTNRVPIAGTGLTYEVVDFYGNGTGFYHETQGSRDPDMCFVEIQGQATMNVRVLRYMSGFSEPYDLAEVQVTIEGDLPIFMSPAGCYVHNGVVPTSTQETGTLWVCSFFDVDERGGHYRNGSGPRSLDDTNIFYEDCELFMAPLSEHDFG